MSQSNSWCITLNNITEEEQSTWEELYDVQDDVSFLVFQIEKGESGTPHLQGYVQFSKRMRLTQLKKLFGPRPHLERAKGDANSNIIYCTKSEGRLDGPFRYGTPSTQGKRNDIHSFVEDMRSSVLSEAQILEQHPTILAKYPRFVATTRRVISESSLAEESLTCRPGWQSNLADYLLGSTDPRQVRWYFDEDGNSGKSYFCRRFRLRDGGAPFIITGGKHADIYYAYGRQAVVIFDWPRCQEGQLFPYAVVEAFKNGYFLSTKYESTPITFTPPHVIVFANFYPDKSKLSNDRWDIHIIQKNIFNTLS